MLWLTSRVDPFRSRGCADKVWEHVFDLRLEEGQWRKRSLTDTPA